jgi:FAD/FMN-containing dehydrogenase
LIKTSAMQEVAIDPDRRLARVGAGVTWGAVVPAAQEHGLIALAGSSHDVGVVGYHLGGGLSFLSRAHGLACDMVRAIELVTADGRKVRASAEEEPDLFWAMRGGGGNFGIVTALEFELLPIPDLHAGSFFFPHERSGEVMEAWLEWTRDLPDELTTDVRMMQFPPLPDIPEIFRGKSFAIVEAVYIGDAETASRLVEPIRALGPDQDSFAAADPMALLALHMDPPGPVPGLTDHVLIGDLSSDKLSSLVQAIGPGAEAPILSFELRLLGGALAERSNRRGALGALEGRYIAFGVGVLAVPEMRPPLEAAFGKARAALGDAINGSHFLNFTEVAVEAESAFDENALARMREVKLAADPENLIRGNHGLA